jgi:hypothetical protein
MADVPTPADAAARDARTAADPDAWLRAFAEALADMLPGILERAEQRAGRAPTDQERRDALSLPVLLLRATHGDAHRPAPDWRFPGV